MHHCTHPTQRIYIHKNYLTIPQHSPTVLPINKKINQIEIRVRVSDEDMTKSKGKDPLEGLAGPMTTARAGNGNEALQQVLSILFEYKPKFQGEKSKVVSCIMAQMEED